MILALFAAALTLFPVPACAAPAGLEISKSDLQIEQNISGGYDLWIRKLPGMGAVLITESTADPAMQAASYALRDPVKNAVNGEEKRILDGKPLDTSRGLYSLIDSTPEPHPVFGQAFHIFIPYIVVYGYPWSRQGEIQILDGTFLNIRAFAKPYGDYTGAYRDNPYVVRVTQMPLEGPPEANYMPAALKEYADIAEEAGGEAIKSTGEEDLPKKIADALDGVKGPDLDLVLALDQRHAPPQGRACPLDTGAHLAFQDFQGGAPPVSGLHGRISLQAPPVHGQPRQSSNHDRFRERCRREGSPGSRL
jgi:hypothetical protein